MKRTLAVTLWAIEESNGILQDTSPKQKSLEMCGCGGTRVENRYDAFLMWEREEVLFGCS